MRITGGAPKKYNLQKFTRLQVMQGFLPTGMWQQHEYYVYIRSRKLGITWVQNCVKNYLKHRIHYE